MMVQVKEVQLWVEQGGQGVPVFLLHGFPLNGEIFAPVLPALVQVAQVVVPDLRGFGRSQKPPSGYDMPTLAEDVVGLANALGLEKFAVVGHSMGGYVALEVAGRHGERVLGLGLLASRARGDSPEAKRAREEAVAALERGEREAFLQSFVGKLLGPWSRKQRLRLGDELASMAREVPTHVLQGCLLGMAARHDHRETVKGLSCPLLVVAGEEDGLIPLPEAQEVAALAPRGRLEVVPQAGHVPTVERPIATAEALARFFKELV